MALVSTPPSAAGSSRFHALYRAAGPAAASSTFSSASLRTAPPAPPGLAARTAPPASVQPPVGTRPRRPPIRRGAVSFAAPPARTSFLAAEDPFADPPLLTAEPLALPDPPAPAPRTAPPPPRPARTAPAYSYAAAHAAALAAQRDAARAEKERRARLVAGILFARALRGSGRPPRRRAPAGCERPYVRSGLSCVVEPDY